MLWYVKSKRAQSDQDDESWVMGGVVPTLNAFDNGDSRATVMVAYPIQDGREMDKAQNGLGVGDNGDPAYTVDTTGAQSVATSVVRRLTPTECERLQGFPDGWTTHRIDEKKGLVEQADSSRYKQMGNAVAVPCVEWVISRLVEQDKKENDDTI